MISACLIYLFYNNLTGGPDAATGKIWVFDQYNNFTKEVAEAVSRV